MTSRDLQGRLRRLPRSDYRTAAAHGARPREYNGQQVALVLGGSLVLLEPQPPRKVTSDASHQCRASPPVAVLVVMVVVVVVVAFPKEIQQKPLTSLTADEP